MSHQRNTFIAAAIGAGIAVAGIAYGYNESSQPSASAEVRAELAQALREADCEIDPRATSFSGWQRPRRGLFALSASLENIHYQITPETMGNHAEQVVTASSKMYAGNLYGEIEIDCGKFDASPAQG